VNLLNWPSSPFLTPSLITSWQLFLFVYLLVFLSQIIIFCSVHIVFSVLKMPSSEERYQAVSTCGSHLSVFPYAIGHQGKLQWLQWCKFWSLKCWTHLSILWRTKSWKSPWGISWVELLHLYHILFTVDLDFFSKPKWLDSWWPRMFDCFMTTLL
jgi:hypothetical protein